MFGIFSRSKETEWDKWIEWQKKNKIPKCYSIEYYNANYYRLNVASSNIYYDNFGDFSYFLEPKNDIIVELLHFYDSCKGYARYFTGDPSCITILKNYLKTNDENMLSYLNFDEYLYDYTKIHAYTVALYSLSTLIVRLAAHHLVHIPKLSAYGINLLISPTNTDFLEQNILHSEIEILQSCPNCKRLCEKFWGDYHVCVDCHRNKICSKCGKDVTNGNKEGDLSCCCL